MPEARTRSGGGAHSILLFVLALAVGLVSITSGFPLTPAGVQCPTAPIQRIEAPVTCCGRVVGYEMRAPKPGEPGFVQCRCAEKRSPLKQGFALAKPQIFPPADADVAPAGARLDPLQASDTASCDAVPGLSGTFFHPPAQA
ncbi:MAG TPA: hypothetical protein VMI31_06535 [Fimbriimonadaceae bacterium]|nr:hypothetical protein [Fimbriimonadaceae bacterium]